MLLVAVRASAGVVADPSALAAFRAEAGPLWGLTLDPDGDPGA